MARCLAEGSLVRAATADVAAEHIRPGSAIIAVRSGIETVERVEWVGRRRLDLRRHARPEQVAPVRIRGGAIAAAQPSRDLLVSPEHAVFIDGVLIQARALINGGSITQERATEAVTYYHIELKSHGVFFANDLAVESYLDNGDRSFFEEQDQPLMLHGSVTPSCAVDPRRTQAACAPFVTAPAETEPVWRRLFERSQQLGHAPAEVLTTADANLHIRSDGRVIRPILDGPGRYVFIVPAGATTVALVSRFGIPSDMTPYAEDSRRLGFAISSITIRSRGENVVLPADFPTRAPGWHDPERAGTSIWRWTDGDAELPLNGLAVASVVTIIGHGLERYPLYDERASPLRRAA